MGNEQNRIISVEDGWEGVIWGRTLCDSRMRCATGTCGVRKSKIEKHKNLVLSCLYESLFQPEVFKKPKFYQQLFNNGRSFLFNSLFQNREQCNGTIGRFPFTVAEFSLNESNDEDVYSVSLINGYNVPILIDPFGGQGLLEVFFGETDSLKICNGIFMENPIYLI